MVPSPLFCKSKAVRLAIFAYPSGQSRYRMKMMSIEEIFGNLFKPEMKSSGRKLVAQEKISLTTQSDTAIQAYVKVAPPLRVSFSADGISSPSFNATCSCPVAKKNRFCKHVWATLLCVEEKFPDFLTEKREIERLDSSPPHQASKQSSYQEQAKLKASEYRKEQYQKQKARMKDKKREQKGLESALSRNSYSVEVETLSPISP